MSKLCVLRKSNTSLKKERKKLIITFKKEKRLKFIITFSNHFTPEAHNEQMKVQV